MSVECTAYTCAECGQTFDGGWSDDGASRELATTFPGTDKTACDVVCDDCYKKLLADIYQ